MGLNIVNIESDLFCWPAAELQQSVLHLNCLWLFLKAGGQQQENMSN